MKCAHEWSGCLPRPGDLPVGCDDRALGVAFGRVGMWRGGGRFGLSVAAPFVWRCPSNLAVTPLPHPAHRTGQADLPHPALGQDACLRPRKVARKRPSNSRIGEPPVVLLHSRSATQPRPPPLGRTFAPRIGTRVDPSLQHVVPAAALAYFRSFVGSPQSPMRHHFQRQP